MKSNKAIGLYKTSDYAPTESSRQNNHRIIPNYLYLYNCLQLYDLMFEYQKANPTCVQIIRHLNVNLLDCRVQNQCIVFSLARTLKNVNILVCLICKISTPLYCTREINTLHIFFFTANIKCLLSGLFLALNILI